LNARSVKARNTCRAPVSRLLVLMALIWSRITTMPSKATVACAICASVPYFCHQNMLDCAIISLSSALRCLPEFAGRQALPAECVLARSVSLQMLEPVDRLLNARQMPCRHPPHHQVAFAERLEPLMTAAVETLVHGLPDETLQRLDV